MDRAGRRSLDRAGPSCADPRRGEHRHHAVGQDRRSACRASMSMPPTAASTATPSRCGPPRPAPISYAAGARPRTTDGKEDHAPHLSPRLHLAGPGLPRQQPRGRRPDQRGRSVIPMPPGSTAIFTIPGPDASTAACRPTASFSSSRRSAASLRRTRSSCLPPMRRPPGYEIVPARRGEGAGRLPALAEKRLPFARTKTARFLSPTKS